MSATSSTPPARIDYRSSYGYIALIVFIAGLGMVVLSQVLPATDLPSWLSPGRLLVLGLLVALLSIHNFLQSLAFNANGHEILLYADHLEFNRVRFYRGRIQKLRYGDITRVEIDRDEDEGGHVKIVSPALSHQFDGEDIHPPEALFTVLLETLKFRAPDAEFKEV